METTHKKSSWDCLKEEYSVKEIIGEGSYGEVRKAIHRKSNCKVAVKRIKLPPNAGMNMYSSVIREITILRKLSKHASNGFSVRLIDIIVPEAEMKAKKIKNIFLVMDYYKYNLRTLLDDVDNSFTQEHLSIIAYNLLCSLNFLHSANILHRDIKP